MVSGLALSDVHGLLRFLGMGNVVPCFIALGMSPLVYILFIMSRKMVWNESGAFFSSGFRIPLGHGAACIFSCAYVRRRSSIVR